MPTSLQMCGWYLGGVVAFLSGLANRSPPFPECAGGTWLHMAWRDGERIREVPAKELSATFMPPRVRSNLVVAVEKG